MYLKSHDSTPYHDAILHACLHNTTYDTQVEGYKTDYIMEIINLTGEVTYYRQHILDSASKIDDDTDDRNEIHLLELQRVFTEPHNIEPDEEPEIYHARKRPEYKILPYSEVKHRITNNLKINAIRWGKHADRVSLYQAASDLLKQEDSNMIAQYLRIFIQVPFPRDPKPLFKFIDIEHRYIPALTLSVLENIKHPKVREFGLQLIGETRFLGRAIGLLKHNFKDGDWTLIEELSNQSFDEETYHNLGRSVLDVFEANPHKQASQTLINIYEYGPCSFCRYRAIEMLDSMDTLPVSIKKEAQYDSNPYIREWALLQA